MDAMAPNPAPLVLSRTARDMVDGAARRPWGGQEVGDLLERLLARCTSIDAALGDSCFIAAYERDCRSDSMPRLHAKHRTEIRYAGAVGESVNEIRLVPSDNGRQQVEWSHVRDPAGAPSSSATATRTATRCAGSSSPSRTSRWWSRPRRSWSPGPAAPRHGGRRRPLRGRIADPAYRDRYAEFLSDSDRIRWTEPGRPASRGPCPSRTGTGSWRWARDLEAEINRGDRLHAGRHPVDTPVEEVVRVGPRRVPGHGRT